MDRALLGIFRSWNWPFGSNSTYSQRPTPYNITKSTFMSPSSVYRAWHVLFDKGYVKKVIFQPDDSLVNRKFAILTGVTYSDFKLLQQKFESAYFLEMIHYGHVYEAYGALRELRNGGEVITLSFVQSSDELLPRQAKIVTENLGNGVEIKHFPSPAPKYKELSEDQARLGLDLAYKNLYDHDLSAIAKKHNVTVRTVRRRIDALLKERRLYAHPTLNQSVIMGFNTALIMIVVSEPYDENELYSRLSSLENLSKKYLEFLFQNGAVIILVYYDSLHELDQCIEEIREYYQDFAVMSKYETVLNDDVYVNTG